MGLNGVGKSTLLQIITGRSSRTAAGSGFRASRALPHHLRRQRPGHLPAGDGTRGGPPAGSGREHRPAAPRKAADLLQQHGRPPLYRPAAEGVLLSDALSASIPGHQMSTLDRQIANVLFAVANQARLLVIDEPFSVLDENETRCLSRSSCGCGPGASRSSSRPTAIATFWTSRTGSLSCGRAAAPPHWKIPAARRSSWRRPCPSSTANGPRSRRRPRRPRAPLTRRRSSCGWRAQHVPACCRPCGSTSVPGRSSALSIWGPTGPLCARGCSACSAAAPAPSRSAGSPSPFSSPAAAISAGIGCVSRF